MGGACALMRACDPDVQKIVLQKGAVAGSKNASALVVKHIKDAKQQVRRYLPTGGPELQNEVENFLFQWNIDSRASDTLRSLHPEAQRTVLEKGGLEGCSNPSSALISRMRSAKLVGRDIGLEAVTPKGTLKREREVERQFGAPPPLRQRTGWDSSSYG